MSIYCHHCQFKISNLSSNDKISKSEECSHCKASLKCCKMCTFYDQNSYNDCREPSADRVVEKEKSNFCDYFQLGASNKIDNAKDKFLAQASKLFKF